MSCVYTRRAGEATLNPLSRVHPSRRVSRTIVLRHSQRLSGVDWYEAWAEVGGERQNLFVFCMRWPVGARSTACTRTPASKGVSEHEGGSLGPPEMRVRRVRFDRRLRPLPHCAGSRPRCSVPLRSIAPDWPARTLSGHRFDTRARLATARNRIEPTGDPVQ